MAFTSYDRLMDDLDIPSYGPSETAGPIQKLEWKVALSEAKASAAVLEEAYENLESLATCHKEQRVREETVEYIGELNQALTPDDQDVGVFDHLLAEAAEETPQAEEYMIRSK